MTPHRTARPRLLPAAVLLLGVYFAALGLYGAAIPESFFETVGPWPPLNEHYIRDVSTYNLALGAGLVMATVRPTWRFPLLAVVCLQFILHAVNHLVDVGGAEREGAGPMTFLFLAAVTALLVWLLARAREEADRI